VAARPQYVQTPAHTAITERGKGSFFWIPLFFVRACTSIYSGEKILDSVRIISAACRTCPSRAALTPVGPYIYI
jgi:hypothetical protein